MPVDTNGGSDAHHHETGDEKVGENMDVAQLVRVVVSKTTGRRFESYRPCKRGWIATR